MISVGPACAEDAISLAPLLGRLDRIEVGVAGSDPLRSLLAPFIHGYGHLTWAGREDGRTLAMGGVIPFSRNCAWIWMLSSDDLRSRPLETLRKMRAECDRLQPIRPVFWSQCVDDPERLRLLRILGFDIGAGFVHSCGVPMRNIYRRRKAAQKDTRRPAQTAHSLCALTADPQGETVISENPNG